MAQAGHAHGHAHGHPAHTAKGHEPALAAEPAPPIPGSGSGPGPGPAAAANRSPDADPDREGRGSPPPSLPAGRPVRPRRRAAAIAVAHARTAGGGSAGAGDDGKGADDAPDAFEPTVDMMVHDFDDERTLDEEEALAACERQDPRAELSSLRREGDMPLEELLALYGLEGGPGGGSRSTAGGGAGEKRERPSAPLSLPPPSPPSGVGPAEVADAEVEKAEPSELRKLYEDGAGSASGAGTGSAAGAEERERGPESSRFLRSVSRPQSEEEDDCDYSPEEEEPKKTIMVGGNYQAQIPEGLRSYDDALPYENEDRLLWNPAEIEESVAEEYMARARSLEEGGDAGAAGSPLPRGNGLRDDERALFLLQQCGHNVEEALRRTRMAAAGAPSSGMSPWSEEECRNFENGLKAHGKDFRLIQQQRVRTRSVGELVQFYYVWKKTERHDMFANRARLEKKKYAMHPGHADYMDRFLEERDPANRERTPSPAAPARPSDAPPDPLAVGREVFSELPRSSPAPSRSAEDTDREENVS